MMSAMDKYIVWDAMIRYNLDLEGQGRLILGSDI